MGTVCEAPAMVGVSASDWGQAGVQNSRVSCVPHVDTCDGRWFNTAWPWPHVHLVERQLHGSDP